MLYRQRAPPPRPSSTCSSDGDNGVDSDADGDSEDRDRDEEDVLAKQAREREQSAIDVTAAVLGAIVRLLAKEVVRDAVGTAAPSKVKIVANKCQDYVCMYVFRLTCGPCLGMGMYAPPVLPLVYPARERS